MTHTPYSGFGALMMEEVILEDVDGTPRFSCTVTFPARPSAATVRDVIERLHRAHCLRRFFAVNYSKSKRMAGVTEAMEVMVIGLPRLMLSPVDRLVTWLWLMQLGDSHATIMAAKGTATIRDTWSEEEILEEGKALGLSAHDIVTFLKIKPSNRAQRRAERKVCHDDTK